MLPVSKLLPLSVLRCDCVKEAGGVHRLISTELLCEWVDLASGGLLMGGACI